MYTRFVDFHFRNRRFIQFVADVVSLETSNEKRIITEYITILSPPARFCFFAEYLVAFF